MAVSPYRFLLLLKRVINDQSQETKATNNAVKLHISLNPLNRGNPLALVSRQSKQQKIEALKEKCKTDLKFLTTKVVGLNRWSDSLHSELVKVLDAPGDRKLILLPRGHQKTTVISVMWVIQQLLRNPNETVGIYSATWKLSKDILEQIKNVLLDSSLKDIFGPFMDPKTGRWNNESIDIAQKNKMLKKDPSISTGGIESGKTGSHCSLMLFDDVVSPELSTTQDQINKVINGYRDSLPLLDPGGRIVVIGTRYSMGDLYGYLLEHEAKSVNGHQLETEIDRKNWRRFLCP